MYHFISGYTAKVAGTEMGVTEPEATFSACFGAAFLVWHPTKYAELLAEKMRKHGSNCWLVNTGWSGGAYGTGKRMSLKYTRAIIDAIHNGALSKSQFDTFDVFGFEIPRACDNVPGDILSPRNTWADKAAFDSMTKILADKFNANFEAYAAEASEEILSAAPKVKS